MMARVRGVIARATWSHGTRKSAVMATGTITPPAIAMLGT